MTEKIFWQDPYQTQLDTRIKTVNGADVTLEKTIIYAFAGGQERDMGSIGEYKIMDARTDAKTILYTLPDHHTLSVGDAVHITIDWQRRYALMRLHFAAEIILELMMQNFDNIEKIGAHIAQDKSRIDFAMDSNIKDAFPLLHDLSAQLIQQNMPIESAFSDEIQQRRYWKIENFGKVACGGTHIKRTGEVGKLTFKRKNIGKGKERIEIYLVE